MRNILETLTLPFKVGYHIVGLGSRDNPSDGECSNEQEPMPFPSQPTSLRSAATPRNTSLGYGTTDLEHSAVSSIQLSPGRQQLEYGEQHNPCSNTCTSNLCSEQTFKQDGYISSILVFGVQITFALSVILAGRLNKGNPNFQVDDAVADVMLIIFMLAGIGCMLALITRQKTPYCRRYIINNLRTSNMVSNSQYQRILINIRDTLQSSLPLVGLLVFFTLRCFIDLFDIVNNITCLNYYLQDEHLSTVSISLSYKILKLLFLAVIIVFCFSFHGQIFRQTITMRYILLTLLCITLSLWFDEYLQEFEDILPAQPGNWTISLCNKHMNVNMASTSLYDRTALYFYPVHLEFALVSVGVLFSFYNTLMDPMKIAASQPLDIPTENLDSTSVCHPSCTRANHPTNSSMPNERIGQHETRKWDAGRRDTDQDTLGSSQSSEEQTPLLSTLNSSRQSSYDSATCCLLKALPIATLSNLLYFTIALLSMMDIPPQLDSSYQQWGLMYESAKLIYFFFLCLTCMIGFMASRRSTSNFTKFNHFELIVVGCCIPSFLFIFFRLISTTYMYVKPDIEYMPIRQDYPTYLLVITIVSDILNIFQLFLQTAFVVHAARAHGPNGRSRKAVKEVLLTLAISNASLWAIDSFILKGNFFSVPATFYGETVWTVIYHTLLPFLLYVRFSSCLLCFSALLKQYE